LQKISHAWIPVGMKNPSPDEGEGFENCEQTK
jgi:hypothetical protein